MRMARSFWIFSQISTLGRCLVCVWLVWVGVAHSNLEGEGGISARRRVSQLDSIFAEAKGPRKKKTCLCLHLVLSLGDSSCVQRVREATADKQETFPSCQHLSDTPSKPFAWWLIDPAHS